MFSIILSIGKWVTLTITGKLIANLILTAYDDLMKKKEKENNHIIIKNKFPD